MSLQPLNDYAQILLDGDEYGFSGQDKDSADSGILTSLPDKFNYYGMYSFSYEASFMNEKALDKLYKYWQAKIGQRVFWLPLSEKGSIIEDEDKNKYAMVKLTSLIAVAEPNSNARNTTGNGEFKA